jgi:hypothetical protein
VFGHRRDSEHAMGTRTKPVDERDRVIERVDAQHHEHGRQQ